MKTKRILNTILLLISLLLISCSDNISGLRDMESPYIVVNTSDWNSKTHCLYSLSTKSTYAHLQNNVIIVDSIGKHNIGDTVYVCIENKHKTNKK